MARKGIETRRPNVKRDICESIGQGLTFKEAAETNGISEPTFYLWLKKDKQFEIDVNAALVVQNNVIRSESRKSLLMLVKVYEHDEIKEEFEIDKEVETLTKRTKTKKVFLPNYQAVQFALTNLEAGTFANKQDLTSGGKPIEGADGFFKLMQQAFTEKKGDDESK